MNARTKINTSYFNGSLLFAALVGWLTSSWLMFFLVAIVLLVGSLHAGDIRMQPSHRALSNHHRR